VETEQTSQQKRILIVLGALLAVVALVLGIVVLTGDDDDPSESTTTSSSTTSSTEATTTTTAATTTTTVDPAEADAALFPDLGTSERYDDPEGAAAAFATDVLGFDTDVIVGGFQAGDSRSGEVELRSFAQSEPTVVLLRQLAGDDWFVIGVTTASIQLGTPIPNARITSPQPLLGQAYAFEGQVDVTLYVGGQRAPLATTFVTGGGTGELVNFTGELTFDAPDDATRGVLVLSSASAEDSFTMAATAIRVRF
jgi:hypothetical protein